MDADVRAVDLLFDDERLIGDEVLRIVLIEVLIVVGSLGAEQVRRPGIFDEVVS